MRNLPPYCRLLFGLLLLGLGPRVQAQPACGWARSLAPMRSLARDTSGMLSLTGSLTQRLQPGGSGYWLAPPGGLATQTSPQGHTVVAGSFRDSLFLPTGWVMGQPGTNLFVVALGPTGTPLWHFTQGGVDTTLNSPGYAATGLAWDSLNGQWVVGGYFRDTLAWGPDTLVAQGANATSPTQQTDGFVGWLAPDGTPLRAVRFGGRKSDRVHALARGPEGNVYVTGRFADTAFFGTNLGDTLHANRLQNPVPGYVFEDAFVACFDSVGSFRWARRAGSPLYNICPGDIGNTVVANAQGVYIGGSLQTDATVGDSTLPTGQSACTRLGFVAAWDTAGTFRWARWVGSHDQNGYASVNTLALDGPNGLLAGGFFNQSGIFAWDTTASTGGSRDGFLLYLDVYGGWVGHTVYGGPGSDAVEALLTTPQQTLYIAGTFTDSLPLPTLDTLYHPGPLPEGFLLALTHPALALDLPDSLTFATCGDSLWVHCPATQLGPLSISPNPWGISQQGEWLRLAPTDTTAYYIAVGNACPQTDSVYVAVPPAAFGLGFTPRDTVLYGDSTVFTAQFANLTPNPDEYLFAWYFADYDSGTYTNPVLAQTPPAIVYDTLGHYTVLLIATHPATGCSDTLRAPNTIILLPDTSTTATPGALHLAGLALLPNPATHTSRLVWQAVPYPMHATALDAQGRVVWSQALPPFAPELSLPVAQWPRGLYHIRLEGPGGRSTLRRLVVQ